MNKYYFQAVSQDGKTITGSIEAQSEPQAREKLANARLAILQLEVFDAEKHHIEEGFLFEFRGRHHENGKTISGTITAVDKYKAYVRLKDEYGLELEKLLRADQGSDEKSQEKALGLQDLEAQYQEAFSNDLRNPEDQTKDQTIVAKALEAQKDKKSFLSKALSDFIEKVLEALETNDLFIQPEKKRIAKRNLNQIDRLKQSNNTKHVEKMLEEVFVLLEHDDFFLSSEEIDDDLRSQYDRSRKDFKHLITQSKNEIYTGIKDVDKSKRIKYEWGFKSINIWEVLKKQAYATALVFVGLSFLILLGGLLGKLLSIEVLYHLFKVLSLSLSFWYWFGLCCLIIFLWGVQFEGARWKHHLFKFGIGIASFVVYSLNAPTLFFWTI